ncbi:MAG: bifunctional UDP-3-O-[3-hydroxymyristoyl] N-acetylglucosamine deacetylase/3-hydroxyacyl-ACP dehydratase [Bacteroidota bacterium]
MNQHTIEKPISIKGMGLHTGKVATLTFHPAAVNHGFKFKRTDLAKPKVIPVDPSKVIDTNRSTTLASGTDKVQTVEHVLSALVGLGLDNVLMEIDGEEVPILDGSAAEIVRALEKAGKVEQELPRDFVVIEEPIIYKNKETGAEYVVLPAEEFAVQTSLNLPVPAMESQFAALSDLANYKKEISGCRTFALLSDLETLAKADLIKGGSLDNAVVFADKKLSKQKLDKLAEKLGQPKLTSSTTEGILNDKKLQFTNEPCRHKLLDLIGDLALVNKPIKGKIIATQPGHTGNVGLAAILRNLYKEQRKLKGKPKYDPNQTPIFDSVKIAEWLPHRYPFLLVDKIVELSDKHVVGIKNVTFNEPFFTGHFPNNPVMPAVLQMEALAQCGGILAMSLVDEPGGWDTYFLKIDNAKFKQMVLPGDTLILKMELLSPIRRGLCHMQGTAYVGNKIVSEGELTAQIVKRK